jgi:hypothetical protein
LETRIFEDIAMTAGLKTAKPIADLTTHELDYLIAKTDGIMYFRDTHGNVLEIGEDRQVYVKTKDLRMFAYQPSRNWRQGGPIIEKYNISLQKLGAKWIADIDRDATAVGNHPLSAAMRALVRLKYGDKVEID